MFSFDYFAPIRVAHQRWNVFKDIDGKAVRMASTPTLAKAEELMEALGADCWAERIGAEKQEERAA